jgi:hypothetical protein
MRRMAGTVVLLASLGGCTSITQSPDGRAKMASNCPNCQPKAVAQQQQPAPTAVASATNSSTWRQRSDPLGQPYQYSGLTPAAGRPVAPGPYASAQGVRPNPLPDVPPPTPPMPSGSGVQTLPSLSMSGRMPTPGSLSPSMQTPPALQPTSAAQPYPGFPTTSAAPTTPAMPPPPAPVTPSSPATPSAPAYLPPVPQPSAPMPAPPMLPSSTTNGPALPVQPMPSSQASQLPPGLLSGSGIVQVEHTTSRFTTPEPAREQASTAPKKPAPGNDAPPMLTMDQGEPKPNAPAVRMVNSKRINLNYEVKDVGPSGIGGVELWYTQDSKSWKKYDVGPQRQAPFTVEVNEEGLYGFTLVARSGVGLGKEPPQPGDLPQVWVEVDLTKPTVSLTSAEPGVSGRTPSLTIRWTATDKNLATRPITLSWSEQADGPWTPIAANLENTGHYVWQLAPSSPRRLLVRVEASDLVGNVGYAQLEKPVMIDMSQPSISILGVEPGSR